MDLARYHRQMLLPGIGEAGQRALFDSHALIVGCGALGTVIADSLARAGVGTLTIVDRDIVELTNLQRQILFDERDVAEGMPKAEAAKQKLARINSSVQVNAVVEDFNHTNAERIARAADIILDGLDNFATRYILNDLSVKHGVPYLYGGAVATTGMACVFLPNSLPLIDGEGQGGGVGKDGDRKRTQPLTPSLKGRGGPGPCLRCVFPEAPPPGAVATCDTAGVLGSVVAMIAQHQVTQTIKILAARAHPGNLEAVDRSLLAIDVWRNEVKRLDISGSRPPGSQCPCCVLRRFEYLEGALGQSATSLCGRGAVQINPRVAEAKNAPPTADLSELSNRLAAHGEFRAGAHVLRGRLSSERGEGGQPIELTIFPDGRTIVAGTARPELARAIYDRYIGG
jgi:adenylyltransferase/sulfurtransferase